MTATTTSLRTLHSNLLNGFVGAVSDGHVHLNRLFMVENLAQESEQLEHVG